MATPDATTGDAAASPDEVPATAGPAPTEGLVRPDFSHKGEAAPATAFRDAAGKPLTLTAFRGKPVLVNLWATWCAPCVAELPTLAALAGRDGGRVQVVAISQDTDAAKAAPFLAARGLTALTPYRDEQMALSLGYQANLPTTILYDAKGREVVRVTGGMDWSGADAAKLLALVG